MPPPRNPRQTQSLNRSSPPSEVSGRIRLLPLVFPFFLRALDPEQPANLFAVADDDVGICSGDAVPAEGCQARGFCRRGSFRPNSRRADGDEGVGMLAAPVMLEDGWRFRR